MLRAALLHRRFSEHGGLQPIAQHPAGADALQLTLRFSFQARLIPGVAMTSNVKSWEQLFSGHHIFFVLGASEEAEPVRDDG